MKYDLTKPLKNGAKRALNSFSSKMFLLLSKKSFEEITIGELCEEAQYPRATFYNYFDDKYDLLGYCWQTLAEQVGFGIIITPKKMKCCTFILTEFMILQSKMKLLYTRFFCVTARLDICFQVSEIF